MKNRTTKIRCDGETIAPDKTYSGKRVLELMDASYRNGYYSGSKIERDKMTRASEETYKDGYKDGYNDGAAELAQLKELLLKIIN